MYIKAGTDTCIWIWIVKTGSIPALTYTYVHENN